MRLTLNGVAATVAATLLMMYSLYSLRIEYYALAMALIVLLLYDMGEASRAERALSSLRAERSVEPRYVEEQGEARVTVRLWNPSSRDIPLLTLVDETPPYVEPLSRTVFTASLPRRAGIEAAYTVAVRAPGRHVWRSIVVEAGGPLGFFTTVRVVEAVDHVVAVPKKPTVEALASSIERIPGLRLRGRALHGLYDLATIREYVAGDDARRILWRHYARTGRLYVREDYGETRARVLVVLDNEEFLWSIGEEPNTLAHLVHRLARAVVEEVLSAEGAVDVVLCSDDAARAVLDITPQTRHRLIDVYSAIEAGRGCRGGFTILSEQLSGVVKPARYTSMVVVASLYTLAMAGPQPLTSLVASVQKPLPVHIAAVTVGPRELEELAPVVKGLERIAENTRGSLVLAHHELVYRPLARGG